MKATDVPADDFEAQARMLWRCNECPMGILILLPLINNVEVANDLCTVSGPGFPFHPHKTMRMCIGDMILDAQRANVIAECPRGMHEALATNALAANPSKANLTKINCMVCLKLLPYEKRTLVCFECLGGVCDKCTSEGKFWHRHDSLFALECLRKVRVSRTQFANYNCDLCGLSKSCSFSFRLIGCEMV